jgi:hypothetical protein
VKIPVDEAPAGAALDAAIEVQLGHPGRFYDYVHINGKRYDVRTWIPEGFTPEDPPAGQSIGRMPKPYSTEITMAWLLLEDLRNSKHKHVSITLPVGDSCEIRVREIVPLGLSKGFRISAQEFPLAASRAFLKVNGVKYVEVPDDA